MLNFDHSLPTNHSYLGSIQPTAPSDAAVVHNSTILAPALILDVVLFPGAKLPLYVNGFGLDLYMIHVESSTDQAFVKCLKRSLGPV